MWVCAGADGDEWRRRGKRRYVWSHTFGRHTSHRTQQTSDEIGKDVPGAAIRTTAASSSSSSRSTAAASSAAAAPAAPAAPNQAVDPDAYLQGYRHQAKAEHPLYTTR